MQFFELNGTIYRITLSKGVDWRDTSADLIERWNPEQRAWLLSDVSKNHVRSFGNPASDPS